MRHQWPESQQKRLNMKMCCQTRKDKNGFFNVILHTPSSLRDWVYLLIFFEQKILLIKANCCGMKICLIVQVVMSASVQQCQGVTLPLRVTLTDIVDTLTACNFFPLWSASFLIILHSPYCCAYSFIANEFTICRTVQAKMLSPQMICRGKSTKITYKPSHTTLFHMDNT